MGTFNNSRFYPAPAGIISQVVSDLTNTLRMEGYEVNAVNLASGGADISITKGGLFKSVIGMKSALKVVIHPVSNGFNAEAGVGIFGQQVVPTIISMLIFWPVLLTQIWGLVQQSKLDDHVLNLIGESVSRQHQPSTETRNITSDFQFCTACGNKVPKGSRFCNVCGTKL